MRTEFFDSHAHLDFADFAGEADAVLERARQAGVAGVVCIGAGSGLDGNARAVAIAARHPDVRAAVGIHPHDARLADESAMSELRRLAETDEVAAIGETGLDYHYDRSPRSEQRASFAAHVRLARETGLPLVVHTREAEDDTIAVLEAEGAGEAGGVIHCFSGTERLARAALGLGFRISFSGILTFPKAEAIRAVARDVVPIERTLVETDSPFLAPVPFRGKRCEPAFVVHTAAKLAEVHGLAVEDVARITTLAARGLFGIAGKTESRIAYPIRNALYLNVTNRCTLGCTFCPKRTDWMVKGHYLRLEREPTAAEVRAAVAEFAGRALDEIVFCGFGEATFRLDLIRELAPEFRSKGLRVRLDTDGLASLREGRDVVPELAGLVDEVSVSLNAADAATYAKLCPSRYGERAHTAALEFIRSAKQHLPSVTASVVAVPGLDVEAARRLVEEIGVRFRVRAWNVVG